MATLPENDPSRTDGGGQPERKGCGAAEERAPVLDSGTGESGLADAFGRRINYARVSLTDRCNFRCLYCMPRQGMPFIPHGDILSYEEILRLCSNLAALGIDRFKVTGGEPFCRKGAAGFIKRLAALSGVREVSLTTNGSLLLPELEGLAASGLKTITFSLDALSGETLRRITRSEADPGAILAAMDRADALGMRVKINTVPLRGVNEAQLLPLARHAVERGWQIRFIELMPVGEGRQLAGVPLEELRDGLEREFGPLEQVGYRTGNGPAVMYSLQDYPGLIGFIAALSGRFCASCNRVRLVSTGFLKTCLCHDAGVDLRAPLRAGATDRDLSALIKKAVRLKPKGHTFSFDGIKESGFNMNSVGG